MNAYASKKILRDQAGKTLGKLHNLSGKPGYCSFACGMPNPQLFPVEEIKESLLKVIEQNGTEFVQYGAERDFEDLKEEIVKRYARTGLQVSTEDILITSGSGQALDIVARTFLEEGDNVLVERPAFMGAIGVMMTYGANLIGVRFDGEDIDTEDFKQKLELYRPKLVYTTPTFHNPSGRTFSKEKREEIAKLLKKSDAILFEDDPYGEIRFQGEAIPTLKQFVGDKAFLLGSFSKIVSPGMRLGWICCTDPELMGKVKKVKRLCDYHSDLLSAKTMAYYMKHFDLDEHIRKICGFYGENARHMAEAEKQYFPKEITMTKPEGGFYMWGDLPESIEVNDIFDDASVNKVIFFPGMPFYPDPDDGRHSFRLSYSCTSHDEIETGMRVLGKVLYNRLNGYGGEKQ